MQSMQFLFSWNHSKNGKILHPATISNALLLDDMISFEANLDLTSHTIYGIRHFSHQVLYCKIKKAKVTWVLMDVELKLYT